MAETIKGLNVIIGAEVTALTKALADVNKQSRDIQTELKEVEKLLKFDPKNTELVAQKQKLLSEAVSTTKEKLDALKAAQTQVNEQFAKGEISEAQYRAFNREVAATEQQLKKFEDTAKRHNSTLADMSKNLQNAGSSETTALAKALADANKQSKDIQTELKEVDRLLKLDPKNTELVAQKQKLLTAAIQNSKDKLDTLRVAQEQVNAQFARGEISEAQYRALQREIVKTEQELKRLETAVGQQSKKWDEFAASCKSVSNRMTDIGHSLALGVTLPLVGAGTAAFKFASDIEDAVGATDQIFKSASQEMQDWANSLESYYGVAEGQALEYANTMGAMLQNIGGLSEAEAAKQSQTLVALAGDLTAMFGGTTESAVQALTGALKGNNSMLDNYGMAVNEALIKSKALEMGLVAEGEQLDLAGKQAATLALIMEQSASAMGQAEREAGGASGTMRALATEIKNISGDLGQILLPIITPLMAKVKEMVERFGTLSPEMQRIIVIVAGVAAALGPLLIVFGAIATAISSILAILPALAGAFAVLTGPIGVAIAIISAFAFAAYEIYAHWDQIKEFFSGLWDSVKDIFSEAITAIADTLTNWGAAISGAWEGTWQNLKNIVGAAWDGIQKSVSMVVNATVDIFKSAPAEVLAVGKEIIQGLWNGIKSMGGWLYEKVTGFIRDSVVGVFNRGLKIESPSKVFAAIGANITQGLGDGIQDNAGYATEQIKRLGDKILNTGNALATGILSLNEKTGSVLYNDTYKTAMKRIDLYYNERDKRVGLMTDGTDENVKQIQKEIEATRTATDIKIKLYEQEYQAKYRLIDDETDERVKALQNQISAIDKLNERESRQKEAQEYQDKLSGLWDQFETADDEDTGAILTEIRQLEADREAELVQQERRDRQEQLREEMELARQEAAQKKKTLEEELEAKKYNLEQQRIEELEHLNKILVLMQEQVKLKEELEKVQTDIVEREQKLQTAKQSEEAKAQTENELEELKQREAGLVASIENNQTALQGFTPELALISKQYGQTFLTGFQSTEGQIKSYISGIVSYMRQQLSSVVNEYGVGGYDGSHAAGLAYVPFDNYRAILHEGERVLTKAESREYQESGQQRGANISVTQNIYSPVASPREEQRRAAREFKKLALGV